MKSAQDAGDDDDLDEYWRLLPSHAHDLVLDRLPVRQRCQMRCVCKAWNNFLHLDAALRGNFTSEEEVWFVMARPPKYGPANWRARASRYGDLDWRFRAYSTSSSLHNVMTEANSSTELARPFFRPPLPNAHHSELSALLGGRSCSRVARRFSHLVHEPPDVNDLFLCSAGALISAMVCKPDAEDSYDIIVFNCLTGCVKVLPPSLNPRRFSREFAFLSMTLDGQDPSCYYIILSDSNESSSYFEFFESRSACWKAVCDLPHEPFRSRKRLRRFLSTRASSDQLSVMGADFWWLKRSRYSRGDCLLAYHVRNDAWTSLLLPSHLCDIKSDNLMIKILMKYKGRLLLALPLECAVDRARLGFGVWELQPATSTWVEVSRTPEHLIWPSLNKKLKPNSWCGDLFANGGLFWMTLCNRATDYSFRPTLVFDVARNAWFSLPMGRTSRKFGCIFVLRPSFSASV